MTSGTRTFARLHKTFPTAGRRFTLAYSEWIDGACIGATDSVESGVIALRQNSYWIALRHQADADSILEAGLANMSVSQSHVIRDKLPRDAWTRVVLEVDLAKNTVELWTNGKKVVEAEPLRSPPSGAQAPRIEVGVLTDNLAAPPTPCTVAIDDVAFDIAD